MYSEITASPQRIREHLQALNTERNFSRLCCQTYRTLVVDINSKDEHAKEMVKIECNATDHQSVQLNRDSHRQKTLSITVKELADVGTVTCHTSTGIVDSKDILLNSLNLPVFKRIFSHKKEPVQCKVKNYSGQFSCSWNSADNSPEFIFEAHRGNYSLMCQEPVRENSDYTVECHDTQSCHYAEEEQNITVILHAIRHKRYENHTLSFALREIIKPDPPQDLLLNKTKNHKHFSIHWKYPKTWCNVHTFFPLIFNIKITKDNDLIEHHENVEGTDLIPHQKDVSEISGFCIQARDMYFNSSWSDWSCYK
ncbi:interleukin-12 subunit beta [Pseudophryne corroboree]|uniref:interleukin-12 subunit beta n=1 Tax=Pseudophryne corroboree TaxID=495146 RepID=UPI003081778B